MENVLIVNTNLKCDSKKKKKKPCSKRTNEKGKGGGGKSHKPDFNFKVSISEIEENHACEHVFRACKVLM